MSHPPFSRVFEDRVRKLEADAHQAGISLTELCRMAKVSRATPDRWRREVPKTITLVEKLEAALKLRLAERAAADAAQH